MNNLHKLSLVAVFFAAPLSAHSFALAAASFSNTNVIVTDLDLNDGVTPFFNVSSAHVGLVGSYDVYPLEDHLRSVVTRDRATLSPLALNMPSLANLQLSLVNNFTGGFGTADLLAQLGVDGGLYATNNYTFTANVMPHTQWSLTGLATSFVQVSHTGPVIGAASSVAFVINSPYQGTLRLFMDLNVSGLSTNYPEQFKQDWYTLTLTNNTSAMQVYDVSVSTAVSVRDDTATILMVPEPATYAMCGVGLLAVGLVKRRRNS